MVHTHVEGGLQLCSHFFEGYGAGQCGGITKVWLFGGLLGWQTEHPYTAPGLWLTAIAPWQRPQAAVTPLAWPR